MALHMSIDNLYLAGKMFGFSPVRQDLSGKFGCLVLSSQETHMPSPVEAFYFLRAKLMIKIPHSEMTMQRYLKCVYQVVIANKKRCRCYIN